MAAVELDTPHGPARAHLEPVDEPLAALVLGHGAAGGVAARDLVAATRAAHAAGVSVALVEQPYRVAGRRSAPRAPVLDAAWTSVVEQLAAGPLRDLPLIVGGRSSGARVACRTATASGAIAVLCLAFPLVAPSGTSRQEELDAAGVPVLVVQGTSDPGRGPRAVGRGGQGRSRAEVRRRRRRRRGRRLAAGDRRARRRISRSHVSRARRAGPTSGRPAARSAPAARSRTPTAPARRCRASRAGR